MDVSIRPATAADAARCADIYRPFVTDGWVSFETEAPDAAEMARRIAAHGASHAWLVARDAAGAVTGYAYGSLHRARAAYATSADVAIYVDPAAARRGVGRALYGALLPLLKENRLRRHRAPQSRQHRAARGDGLHPGRHLSRGRLEARRVARRRLVAADSVELQSATRNSAAAGATDVPLRHRFHWF